MRNSNIYFMSSRILDEKNQNFEKIILVLWDIFSKICFEIPTLDWWTRQVSHEASKFDVPKIKRIKIFLK